MSRANFKNIDQTGGFSLVEVMVGLTLGLFTVIIIMQAFLVFENQKRITTAGSDAQENGLMAMVQLEQQIRNAGTGLADSAACDCNIIYSYYNGASTTTNAPIVPVVIKDGGATGSDEITTTRGTDFLGSIPAVLTDTMPQPSAELDVNRTMGFVDGKLILVSQDGICTVMQVSQVQDAALKIQHNPGGGYPWNPPGNFYNSSPGDTWHHYTTGAKILTFGGFVVDKYSIGANHNLQLESSTGAVATPAKDIVSSIVSLKAQYGVSAAGSQNVLSTGWVNATGEWAFNALDSAHAKRIKAVRITVVARSSKKETGNVTTSFPGATPDNPGGIDISALPDWQKYRYRVYTTIIPLRNIIWANL